MNILNMYVLQCILCESEWTFFRIYGALQIKIISIIKTRNNNTEIDAPGKDEETC